MKVYNLKNILVFEGKEEDCLKWIFDKGEKLSDGRIIYRTWTNEQNETFYDVGKVYYVKD